MSSNDEARDFLVSRRAQITLAQVGLPEYGDERRVPGLRREEVAELAGVSVGYYTRLERGEIGGASESVLDAVAKALRLTDVEREHLHDLARRSPAPGHSEGRAPSEVRASLVRLVDSMGVPAIVQTPRLDLVAANALARELFSQVFEAHEPNFARFNYLDPRAREFYVDWPLARRTGAAILRREAGRDPLDEVLTELIGELSTLSPLFREDWARRDVHEHRTGTKPFVHPEVGRLDLVFEVLETPGDSTYRLVTYSAEPGTEAAEKLAILGSLAVERRD
ncbi:MAG: helix-turn-helix transcriptional regulator [Microbacterium sp.]|jgi:transcriptional regulator with XRE-family HTH domain|uniref:helix-turn-helix transcriptional regulator n=1 Tax=Microbacterium sp. TaxID=51671 RepID=UPI00281C06AD|nr:helix-turn-helix transcriptional regulator [Microbacterium sp.]MDR2323416.1 helix-turn-helix transcriptional regulator [Microbacterium sp.]